MSLRRNWIGALAGVSLILPTLNLGAATLPIVTGVELQPFTAKFELPLPTADELRAIVVDVAADWGAAHGQRNVQTTDKVLDQLVRNLTGLTATDARVFGRPNNDCPVAHLSDAISVVENAVSDCRRTARMQRLIDKILEYSRAGAVDKVVAEVDCHSLMRMIAAPKSRLSSTIRSRICA